MLRVFVTLAAIIAAAPSLAQEPVGCDHFKFNVDKDRALLNSGDIDHAGNGDTAPLPSARAVELALALFETAKLPVPPERAPKPDSPFAGYVRLPGPPQAGSYKITISDAAWIDVIQDGRLQKSSAFSGVTGCAGIRKSVIFALNSDPFTVEISGVKAPSIKLAVTAAQ
jgi:hypothetical protein